MNRFSDETVRALVERTRRASGVPLHLEDPVAIQQIADILNGSDVPKRRATAPPTVITPTEPKPPQRPGRTMPSLKKIAQWHRLNDVECFRCGYRPPVSNWVEAAGWLERAHVIDRCGDGLDLEANLRPLCTLCHRQQPMFLAGQEEAALAWFDGDMPS